jgi:hypothetical protein
MKTLSCFSIQNQRGMPLTGFFSGEYRNQPSLWIVGREVREIRGFIQSNDAPMTDVHNLLSRQLDAGLVREDVPWR